MTSLRLSTGGQAGHVPTCNDDTGAAGWQPPSGGTGGLTLPYNGTADSATRGFAVANAGTGAAGFFETAYSPSAAGSAELGVFEDAGEWIYKGYGIRAFGSRDGGYFENSSGTAHAHVAHRDYSPMIGSWGVRRRPYFTGS